MPQSKKSTAPAFLSEPHSEELFRHGRELIRSAKVAEPLPKRTSPKPGPHQRRIH